jgi:hypothetical protein
VNMKLARALNLASNACDTLVMRRSAPPRRVLGRMGRSVVRADNTSSVLEVSWPYFGLAVTPNADNCCALLSNVLAGQRLKSLAMRVSVYLRIRRLAGMAQLRTRITPAQSPGPR